jgi:hypothetical protein
MRNATLGVFRADVSSVVFDGYLFDGEVLEVFDPPQ